MSNEWDELTPEEVAALNAEDKFEDWKNPFLNVHKADSNSK